MEKLGRESWCKVKKERKWCKNGERVSRVRVNVSRREKAEWENIVKNKRETGELKIEKENGVMKQREKVKWENIKKKWEKIEQGSGERGYTEKE